MTEPDAPRWKRWIRRLAAPSQELFAANVRDEVAAGRASTDGETGADYTPLGRLEDRQAAVVAGRLRTVVLRVDGRSPSVEAELFDGTGQVGLVWMGRRRIVGLEAGTRLVARGRAARGDDGRLVIYNPIYELRP